MVSARLRWYNGTMSDKQCDFLVVSRTFGRTTVKEFTNQETTQLLEHVVQEITGVRKEHKELYKATYVDIYSVSYHGELTKVLSWFNSEKE
jgi:hypothetical protein